MTPGPPCCDSASWLEKMHLNTPQSRPLTVDYDVNSTPARETATFQWRIEQGSNPNPILTHHINGFICECFNSAFRLYASKITVTVTLKNCRVHLRLNSQSEWSLTDRTFSPSTLKRVLFKQWLQLVKKRKKRKKKLLIQCCSSLVFTHATQRWISPASLCACTYKPVVTDYSGELSNAKWPQHT